MQIISYLPKSRKRCQCQGRAAERAFISTLDIDSARGYPEGRVLPPIKKRKNATTILKTTVTQQQLADAIDVSRRVIAYYEVESDNPPGNIIMLLSKALNITSDELLGLTPTDTGGKPNLKLTRRMKEIENLPPAQQKVLLKTIDTFLKGAQA